MGALQLTCLLLGALLSTGSALMGPFENELKRFRFSVAKRVLEKTTIFA
jgi:hypothetical protein